MTFAFSRFFLKFFPVILAVLVGFCLNSPQGFAANQSLYRSAPMLKSLEEQNLLPEVEQRLPNNPMLLQPVEEIGQFGGTWTMAMRKSSDHALLIRTLGYENLMRWSPEWTNVIPNIAQSVEANADSSEFIFTLREGMKWSDGEPFGPDDILFWYNDVYQNEVLKDKSVSWRAAESKFFTVEKISDSKVRFQFEEPHGLFLQLLSTAEGAEPTAYPFHYLKKFHLKYNPDANDLAKQLGFKDWSELFISKVGLPGNIDDASRWTNPQLPTLNAWLLQGTYGTDWPLIATRNPYYWKIDTAFNQLPYFDQLTFIRVADKAEAAEAAKAGLIDMQARHVGKFVKDIVSVQPTYSTFGLLDADMNSVLIHFNLTHKDPILRDLFNVKNFRVALSYGINRKAIIDKYFNGEAAPHQAAPRPESPYFNEKLAHQFLDFDPVRANSMLDIIGLERRDSEGFRTLKDGRRLSFLVETVGSPRYRILEMIRDDWAKLGVEAKIVDADRNQFYAKRKNNDHDASVWGGDGGIDAILYPLHYFPYNFESFYAVPWARWYMDHSDPMAEYPPEAVRKQMALYDKLKSYSSQNDQSRVMQEILDIAAEQFYAIGINLPLVRNGIVKNDFKNVPAVMPGAWTYPSPAPTNPAQYYRERP